MRLSRDYKSIQRSPIPFIKTAPSSSNILDWSFLITGPPSTVYANGQYYGMLTFPPTFPYAGPTIRVLTPSGRFVPNHFICTTFTSLHPEEWNPAWTVETILTGFLSFMTSEEYGAGCIIKGDQGVRAKCTEESKKWNSLNCERFRQDFPDEHHENVASQTFTEEEMKTLVRIQKEPEEATGTAKRNDSSTKETLLDTSFETHTREDWEKFGSMEDDFDFYEGEDDFDYYEGEDDEDCETP